MVVKIEGFKGLGLGLRHFEIIKSEDFRFSEGFRGWVYGFRGLGLGIWDLGIRGLGALGS